MAYKPAPAVDNDVQDLSSSPTVPLSSQPVDKSSLSPSQAITTHLAPSTPPTAVQNLAQYDTLPEVAFTPTTSRINASKDLPSTKDIDGADVTQLRDMIKHLVEDLTSARITAANTKLQHNLLSMQTSQAAERAEVEHQLSRRQVDFLRVRQSKADTRLNSTGFAVQPPTKEEVLAQNLYELEERYLSLEDLCDKLKKEKDSQQEHIESLTEHNTMLINRIRENREHLTRIRERSPNFATPREVFTTPRRKGGYSSRFRDDTPAHGPFAALIAADQILSQDVTSVPATPSRSHTSRAKGHSRGVRSLSALQTPKSQALPNSQDKFLGPQLLMSAPGPQIMNESAEREHRDRDSTISVSDNEVEGDDGAKHSQASFLATDMLRKDPANFAERPSSRGVEVSSSLLQSKLFGPVTKTAGGKTAKLKRLHGNEDNTGAYKKIRTDDRIGLGIET